MVKHITKLYQLMLCISVQLAHVDAVLAILISVLGRQNDTVLRDLLD